jgi:hypothetical protein
MSPEEIASHTLELLRQIRAEQASLALAFDDFRSEMRERVGGLERKVADLHGDFAGLSMRVDRIDARLQRIERRLDLIDPALPPQ